MSSEPEGDGLLPILDPVELSDSQATMPGRTKRTASAVGRIRRNSSSTRRQPETIAASPPSATRLGPAAVIFCVAMLVVVGVTISWRVGILDLDAFWQNVAVASPPQNLAVADPDRSSSSERLLAAIAACRGTIELEATADSLERSTAVRAQLIALGVREDKLNTKISSSGELDRVTLACRE